MNSITIIADGSTRFFAFPFAIFSADEIEVLVDGVAITAGIDIVGEGASDGGHVTFLYPPLSGATVTLRRKGKVEVSDQDAPGFLEDKLVAGANIAIAKTAVSGGEALVISATFNGDDYLRKDQNLADLPNDAAARANLGLGSAAILDAGTGAGDLVQLDAQGRLPAVDGSQLTDIPFGRVKVSDTDTVADFLETKLVAGDNVTLTPIAGTSGDALEIAVATDPAVDAQLSVLSAQVSNLIWNQGVLALRSQIGAGWSVLKMVDGWADEFEDEAGVDAGVSANATFNSSAAIYGNSHAATAIAPTAVSSTMGTQGTATSPNGVIDGSLETIWDASDTSNWQGHSLTFDLGAPQAPVQFRMAFYGSTWGTVHWRVDRSADNVNFTQVAASVSITYTQDRVATPSEAFANNVPARYIRLTCLDSKSAHTGDLAEIDFLVDTVPQDMTLVSNAVLDAQSAPVEARLLLLHEPVDAVTLDTDLIAEVSRDGGATWSAATLTDEGAFDASTRILAGIADLSAQPAGTAMKWRVRTLNAKSQRLHGVWIQWR